MTKIRTGGIVKPRTVNTFSSTLFIGQTFHNLSQEMKTVLDFDGSSITQVNATFNLETPGFNDSKIAPTVFRTQVIPCYFEKPKISLIN